jgi:UDP-N-acetyl-D-mannosaminuronate dehydrogenase
MTPASNAAPAVTEASVGISSAAIGGMGYVGLPTALGLYSQGITTLGVDLSTARLIAIESGDPDLIPADRAIWTMRGRTRGSRSPTTCAGCARRTR